MEFKQHLGSSHNISYEAGFVLAIGCFSTENKMPILKGSTNPLKTNKPENLIYETKVSDFEQTQERIKRDVR